MNISFIVSVWKLFLPMIVLFAEGFDYLLLRVAATSKMEVKWNSPQGMKMIFCKAQKHLAFEENDYSG